MLVLRICAFSIFQLLFKARGSYLCPVTRRFVNISSYNLCPFVFTFGYYSCVLVCYSYVLVYTRMLFVCTRMLLVCTRMLFVCTRMYSCILVCYSYVLVWCFSHDHHVFVLLSYLRTKILAKIRYERRQKNEHVIWIHVSLFFLS